MDWNKFKEMTLKQRLQWLVSYYGIAALIFIVAVIVIVMLVKSIFSPAPISDVCVLMFTEKVGVDESNSMEEELNSILGKEVNIDAYVSSDVYAMQAFVMKLLTDQVDILVFTKEQKEELMADGYLESCEAITNDIYIGITERARKSEELDKVYDYLLTKLK